MTPRTSRISPHTQSPHIILDYLAALTNCRISSGYLRIPCPAHGGTNTNLSLWVNDEGIAARCHSAGCSYADIAKATLDRYGISINPSDPKATPPGSRTSEEHRDPGQPPRTSAPTHFVSGTNQSPFPTHPNTPPGCGLPAVTYGAQSYPCPGQSAGSAPNTSTTTSRAPAP